MNSYFSNGIHIESEIHFPELHNAGGAKPELEIKYGSVPRKLNDAVFEQGPYQISPTSVLLDAAGVARYLVCGSTSILVDPYPGADENVVRMFILSSVLAVVLHKKAILPLHAATIKVGDQCVLIAGNSGAGKSTLSLGLYHRGFEVLNDDISPVQTDESGQAVVFPGHVHLKLWRSSFEMYGYNADTYRPLRNNGDKFSFPVAREKNDTPLRVGAIIFLYKIDGAEPQCERMNGVSAFSLLQGHTARRPFLSHFQTQTEHFKICTLLANKAAILQIGRPVNIKAADFVDYVHDRLNELFLNI